MKYLLKYFGEPRFNLLDVIFVAIATKLFYIGEVFTGILVFVLGLVFASFIQTFCEKK